MNVKVLNTDDLVSRLGKKIKLRKYGKGPHGHVTMIQGPLVDPTYWISMYPGADSGYHYFIVADNYLNDDGTPYEDLSALNPFKEDELIFLDE